MTYQSMPVQPRQLRPGRVWYLVAGIILAIGVAAGVVLLLVAIAGFRSLPSMKQQFNAGETATITLTADKQWAIYAAGPDTGPGSTDARPEASCTARGPGGGEVSVTRTGYSFSTSSGGGPTWYVIDEISVTQDGPYEITCAPAGGTDAARYAIGEAPDLGRFFGSIGAVFGTIGAPCITGVVAVIIVIVTAVRRSSHRKRMQQQGG